jgi:integrase
MRNVGATAARTNARCAEVSPAPTATTLNCKKGLLNRRFRTLGPRAIYARPRAMTSTVKRPRGYLLMSAPTTGKDMMPLSPNQARTLLETARGERLETLYALAVTTGMRQGELLGLKWEDVDMETGTLQVRRTLSTATGSGIRFGAPKTAKSRRSIRIPELALSSLRRHRRSQLQERIGLWEDLRPRVHY